MRTPQRIDSVVRTLTASLLAIVLVGATVALAFQSDPAERLSGMQAVLVGWAGVIVGFYFGGHVAQNTAALEEARQVASVLESTASANRSEASAQRAETAVHSQGGHRD